MESKSPKSKLQVQSIGLGRHRSFTRKIMLTENNDDVSEKDIKSTKNLDGTDSSENNSIDESQDGNDTEENCIIEHRSNDSILGIECLPATFLDRHNVCNFKNLYEL